MRLFCLKVFNRLHRAIAEDAVVTMPPAVNLTDDMSSIQIASLGADLCQCGDRRSYRFHVRVSKSESWTFCSFFFFFWPQNSRSTYRLQTHRQRVDAAGSCFLHAAYKIPSVPLKAALGPSCTRATGTIITCMGDTSALIYAIHVHVFCIR